MSKRLISFLTVVFLLAALTVGCGKAADKDVASTDVKETSTEKQPATEEASPKAEESAAKAEEPVTLNLWTSKDDSQWDKDMRAKFQEAYPYITLKTTLHEGDAGNDFFQSVAIGTAPDVAIFSQTVVDQNVRAGSLAPLDDYFASWEDSSNYLPVFLDGFKFNGKLYALPWTGSTMLFAYNKALFKVAGIAAPPQTWDEMLADAKLLTKPDKQQAGYGILAAEWTEWFFQYYVWQAGGDLTVQNPDNTLKLTFTDPAVIKAAQFYQQLSSEKVIQSDITMKFDKIVEAFAQGKIAMMPFATDWVGWAVSMGMKYEDIGLAPFPAGPSGKRTTSGGVGGTAINAKSPKAVQDAAWKYITFMNTKQTITDRLLWLKANQGLVNPVLLPRTDYTLADVGVTDPDMVKTISDVSADTRPTEFYGKGTIGKYVDQAVQKIVANPKADPVQIFQKQQDLATKEALDDFNKAVLEKK